MSNQSMMYAKLNGAQRAFIQSNAQYAKDQVIHGRVIKRGDAKNAKAVALQTSKALERDADRARDRANRDGQMLALAAFTADELSKLATKLPSGKARGCNELQRKRAGAVSASLWG